jgi:hypothetical protein
MSMKPAIRNWQSHPPPGGWTITYTLPGTSQQWVFAGLPGKVVGAIADVQRANGIFAGFGPIWDLCNAIWTERDPVRALPYNTSAGQPVQPAQTSYTMPRSTARAKQSVGCRRCG